MAQRRSTPRKRATKRRTTASKARRRPVARKPRRGGLGQRAAVALAGFVARRAERHTDTKRARRDAAILRATHAGCAKCGGAGMIVLRKKDGSFAGSKSCPAKPKTTKVSRTKVAMASRFGVDKTSGLIGWSCPCGKREKPRYRDAKTATAALRSHERKVHGAASVGGAWYAQVPAGAAPQSQAPVKTTKTKAAASKAA